MDDQGDPASEMDLLLKLQNQQPLNAIDESDASLFNEPSSSDPSRVPNQPDDSLGSGLTALQDYSDDSSSQNFVGNEDVNKIQESDDTVNLLPEEELLNQGQQTLSGNSELAVPPSELMLMQGFDMESSFPEEPMETGFEPSVGLEITPEGLHSADEQEENSNAAVNPISDLDALNEIVASNTTPDIPDMMEVDQPENPENILVNLGQVNMDEHIEANADQLDADRPDTNDCLAEASPVASTLEEELLNSDVAEEEESCEVESSEENVQGNVEKTSDAVENITEADNDEIQQKQDNDGEEDILTEDNKMDDDGTEKDDKSDDGTEKDDKVDDGTEKDDKDDDGTEKDDEANDLTDKDDDGTEKDDKVDDGILDTEDEKSGEIVAVEANIESVEAGDKKTETELDDSESQATKKKSESTELATGEMQTKTSETETQKETGDKTDEKPVTESTTDQPLPDTVKSDLTDGCIKKDVPDVEINDDDDDDDVTVLDDDVTVLDDDEAPVRVARQMSTESKDTSVATETPSETSGKSKDKSNKTPLACVVCKKVGRCKYNIVRNGDTKHLCDDDCFSKFRSTPTLYLRAEKKDDGGDDDIEIVGTSRVPTVSRSQKTSTISTPSQVKSSPMTSAKSPGARQILCTVCKQKKVAKHEVSFNRKMNSLCSDKCFAAFRYANKLSMTPCDNCSAFCSEPSSTGSTTESIQFEGITKRFCGVICLHSFRSKKKRTTPCTWCNTKKSNFDMVERVDANNKVQMFCTLNCLSLYRVNLQATSNQQVKCDQCNTQSPAQYHLTMSDASVRNFCSYPCVISFQSQFTQPGSQKKGTGSELSITSPASANKNTRQSARVAARSSTDSSEVPVISDVVSLADKIQVPKPIATNTKTASNAGERQTTHIIIQPPKPKIMKNKSLLCRPYSQTKATSCRPMTQSKSTQTEGEMATKPILIPVPVPIYIPTPMAMYCAPQPYPIPIPVPIPIPCFIPTTRKSADGILKQIKDIQERMPADPFEAELLMMAEAVATADKSYDDTTDDDNDEDDVAPLTDDIKYNPGEASTSVTTSADLGEDMLQMALRMASEISEEPVLDLEDSLNPTPIQPMSHDDSNDFSTIDQSSGILSPSDVTGRGRRGRPRGRGRGRNKRARYSDESVMHTEVLNESKMAADADMVLKYTYGVNAWKHWVVQKNTVLEKTSTSRRLKLFKVDILACTAEELNFYLCLFVKEVRKPNGEEYAPDSIFYLCLGIQQYLYENGRIDDIFSNSYYEGFTDALNEVLAGYEIRLNAHGLLVCRIEEEHLWESKQLGAHSPYILLNTLIYFNTKYFFLKSPEEHLKLSFSHIMKHWKRANGQPITGKGQLQGGAKNVYLRYYAPAPGAQTEAGQKRKREEAPIYEQAENTDNPLRCPVKLYEFYLSKCPESIKHRNDVFYLVPERSCVPDSPVWYSTAALGVEVMSKMLNRLRLVREIQEAHLHSTPVQYSLH